MPVRESQPELAATAPSRTPAERGEATTSYLDSLDDFDPVADVLMDVLGAAAADGRLSWEAVVHQLGVGTPTPAPSRIPLDPFDLPASARNVLARIEESPVREQMVLYAFLVKAATGASGDGISARGFPDGPDWWSGADPDEILAFDFFPGGPSGDDLRLVEAEVLDRRLHVVRLRDGQGHRTKWLDHYASQLVAEVRRRKAGV